jgi:hypothetical protein
LASPALLAELSPPTERGGLGARLGALLERFDDGAELSDVGDGVRRDFCRPWSVDADAAGWRFAVL